MLPPLILIDGSGFIFRAYHALPPLKRPDGLVVGAVYGFCTMLQKILQQHEKSPVLVVFDSGRQTFRQDIYPEYKAHRPLPPEDLVPQFPLIRQACKAYGLSHVELSGVEADDLIATYAKLAEENGQDVLIITGDKDLMQLIRPKVQVFDPIKNIIIGPQEVYAKFGVLPETLGDALALAGDSSDNIPGVPGIGVKTAAELLTQFHTLENLLQNASSIKQPKRRQLLIDFADQARMSRLLVTLKEDVENLPVLLEEITKPSPKIGDLSEFLTQHGFRTLLSRIQTSKPIPTPSLNSYVCIQEESQLIEYLKKAEKFPWLAIDCETTSLNVMQAKLVGISLCYEKGHACYIPINHQSSLPQLNLETVQKHLRHVLTNPAFLKIGHNIKYDLSILQRHGFEVTPYDDTMIMSYVLDGGKHRHNMDFLSNHHLNRQTMTYESVVGKGKKQLTFDYVDLRTATDYAAEDADITLQLYEIFSKRLVEEKLAHLYHAVERPLPHVISKMEQLGILVDQDFLRELGVTFAKKIQDLEEEITKLAGHPFTIGSPKQLGDVLFKEQGLPVPKKTKTGQYITDADVLEVLSAQGHVLPQKVLQWRGLSKLQSTYVTGLLDAVDPVTKRIHTSFSLAATTTGRLASSEPNLQNIPIRTQEGRQLRKAFIAKDGYVIASLDYSQIELRLLAHMGEISALIDIFKDPEADIHRSTAAQMFQIPAEQVDYELRRRAKIINFGIIYGMSAYGLSQQLGVSQSQAAQLIRTYFERFPGIEAYMERSKQFARDNGYVETLMGRRCYTPGILEKNAVLRQFAERQAINAPLQGSNADIIKCTMTKIDTFLTKGAYKSRLLLQVHDELLFEISLSEKEKIIPHLKKMMETVVFLKVPLVVGVGSGHSWEEAH